jgi:hypothetical protein
MRGAPVRVSGTPADRRAVLRIQLAPSGRFLPFAALSVEGSTTAAIKGTANVSVSGCGRSLTTSGMRRGAGKRNAVNDRSARGTRRCARYSFCISEYPNAVIGIGRRFRLFMPHCGRCDRVSLARSRCSSLTPSGYC